LGIDEKTIYKLFEEFLTQLKDEKSIFYTALKNKDYKTLHEVSHKLKGVSSSILSPLSVTTAFAKEFSSSISLK
jgi:HPt (histidine-containing phosphotransfer) domain-containing protein